MVAANDTANRRARQALLPGVKTRLSFYFVLAIFCSVSLIWSLLAGLLFRVLPRRTGSAVGRCVISTGCRAGLALMRALGLAEFELESLDPLRAEGAMIITCNHLSLIDAVLVLSRLPNAVCIAKAELWDNRFLRGIVQLAGYIRNDTPLALLRAAITALKEGRQLLIFPEGTRLEASALADGSALRPFRPGFALMAKVAGVPVQTGIISSNTPYLRHGWPLHRLPEFPLCYRVRCGARVTITADVREATEDLRYYFAQQLRR